jgi:GNAT superfamily N-acetyltransferase
MARTRIFCKPVSKLSAREYGQCRRLTMGDEGEMRGCLEDARRYDRMALLAPGADYTPGQVPLLREIATDKLLGWCLFDGRIRGHAQIYVHPRWRGQGLGTRLMRKLVSMRGDVSFMAWDETSYTFFKTVSRKLDVSFGFFECGYYPPDEDDEDW